MLWQLEEGKCHVLKPWQFYRTQGQSSFIPALRKYFFLVMQSTVAVQPLSPQACTRQTLVSLSTHHQEPLTSSNIGLEHLVPLIRAQLFLSYSELALNTPIIACFKLAFTSFPAPLNWQRSGGGTGRPLSPGTSLCGHQQLTNCKPELWQQSSGKEATSTSQCPWAPLFFFLPQVEKALCISF